jgi:hypothetical protein
VDVLVVYWRSRCMLVLHDAGVDHREAEACEASRLVRGMLWGVGLSGLEPLNSALSSRSPAPAHDLLRRFQIHRVRAVRAGCGQ